MIARTVSLLISLFILVTSNGQFTNGGFENWSDQFLYETLEEWTTGNGQTPPYVQTTKLSASAPDGAFGVHLETEVNANDTVFGFVLLGDFNNNLPMRGVPFSTEITYLNAQIRYDIQPNDTALVLFTAWAAGSIVSIEEIKLSGTQSTWMNWNYFLTFPATFVDSVLVGAASSNPFNIGNAVDGSWLELDNIQLLSPNVPVPDTIPNHSFEDWMDVSIEDPDGWTTYNSQTVGYGITNVTKSSDAFAGQFSAELTTEMFSGSLIPGVLTNGWLDANGPVGGVPYTAQPAWFSGQYKYAPSGTDTAFVAVYFFENGIPVEAVGSSFGSNTNMWTYFSVNISLVAPPDTMLLVAFSGQNAGSVLLLDDLNLSGGTVGIDVTQLTSVMIFPSPVNDMLHVVVPQNERVREMRLLDMNGRILRTLGNGPFTDVIMIPVHDLARGAYLLELSTETNTTRHRFIKQ